MTKCLIFPKGVNDLQNKNQKIKLNSTLSDPEESS